MSPNQKQALVAEAKEYLTSHPQDLLHDLNHHARVLALAKQIVAAEKLEKQINTDLLEVVCWWHDVQVPHLPHNPKLRIAEETAQYVAKKLPESLAATAFDAIKNHEFRSRPETIEGKILQDADKLEVLSEERWETGLTMVDLGHRTPEQMIGLVNMALNEWLPEMPNYYHFNFSRNYHAERETTVTSRFKQAIEILQLKINQK